MPEDNRQTLGESYVGVSFNPSGSGDVDTIKQKAAELIDLIGNLPTGFAATALFDHYWAWAKSIAITHVKTAFCVRNQSRTQMRTLLAFILYLFSIISYPLYSFTMNHRLGEPSLGAALIAALVCSAVFWAFQAGHPAWGWWLITSLILVAVLWCLGWTAKNTKD